MIIIKMNMKEEEKADRIEEVKGSEDNIDYIDRY